MRDEGQLPYGVTAGRKSKSVNWWWWKRDGFKGLPAAAAVVGEAVEAREQLKLAHTFFQLQPLHAHDSISVQT